MLDITPPPAGRLTLDWSEASLASTGPLRIVALGGGNGLSMLLRGLRMRCAPGACGMSWDMERITAIVTVADDGGSSGGLRRAFHILAPGDIRNCLLALSDADPVLQALFNYRFDGQLGEHSLGNLMLTALTQLERDFPRAVQKASELLEVHGRIFPVTGEQVELRAEFDDGSEVIGESNIAACRRAVQRVSLVPTSVKALPKAIDAIESSDLVIIGPGSLYTSLIPNLLVHGIAEAIRCSGAHVVLVMNLMTEPGETNDYTAGDVLDALLEHAPDLPIHTVLMNNAPLPLEILSRYAEQGAAPILADPDAIRARGCRSVSRNLLGDGKLLRHDPGKLAAAALQIAEEDVL